jgi:hypothetical protein
MRNVADKVIDNKKTHFVFSNFFFESRAVYEIMWKNVVERGRPQITILYAGYLRLQTYTQVV